MSTSTKLGNEFLRIPKLDVSGSNWVIFKECFIWALDARGIIDHIDGTSDEPTNPVSEAAQKRKEGLSAEEIKSDNEWKKELKEWKSGEAVAKQQITSSIPDSLFLKIHSNGSTFLIWKALEDHFQKRSQMVAINLHRHMQNQCCGDKDNIIAHFAVLQTMQEDLASMGQKLEDSDFYAIVMGSLPGSYDPYISTVNATSSVLGTTLSADDLILTVTEEYKRRTLKNKGGKKDDNVAFYSNDAGKDQKGGLKRKGECHNCGKKGHWMRDCWEEGGRKEGQGPKQKGKGKGKGKAKEKGGKEKDKEVAVTATDEKKPKEEKLKDEEAWMAMVLEDTPRCINSHHDFNDLCISSFHEEAYSCFIDDEALAYSPPELNLDISTSSNGNVDHNLGAWISNMEIHTSLEYVYLVGRKDTRTEVDLYDSGATRHMSGFFHKFTNFVTINPIPITAADK